MILCFQQINSRGKSGGLTNREAARAAGQCLLRIVIGWFRRCPCGGRGSRGACPAKADPGALLQKAGFDVSEVPTKSYRPPESAAAFVSFPPASSISSLPAPHLFSRQSFGTVRRGSAELQFLDDRRQGLLFF